MAVGRKSITRAEQYADLTGWDHPVLGFGVTPARETLLRLDRAFAGFFRRVKKGDKPGFPRFESAARWDSVEYPQTTSSKITGTGRTGRLYLQGVGHVVFRTSRRGMVGRPKTLVVKREGRRWRACIACEVDQPEPLAPTGKAVGIDLGVEGLVATSEGDLVENHCDHADINAARNILRAGLAFRQERAA